MTKKINFYKQCTFTKSCKGGYVKDVAWIPEDLAGVGKVIYFTDYPDILWKVETVGDTRRSQAEAQEKVRVARRFGPSLNK